ncbi:MAG: polysaccharide deacetylase family protein, partial [Myxococcota bacterium]
LAAVMMEVNHPILDTEIKWCGCLSKQRGANHLGGTHTAVLPAEDEAMPTEPVMTRTVRAFSFLGWRWALVGVVLWLGVGCTSVSNPKISPETPVAEHHTSPTQSKTWDVRHIALTFDDAPRGQGPVYSGAERGQALVKALAEADSGPVAFFVTTRGFEQPGGRERIARYAAAGHLVGNHTHTHPWLSKSEVDTYVADIEQATRHLQGLANVRPWFRFPYLDEGRPLDKRKAIQKALQTRGLRNGYVTIDNYDWYLERRWHEAVQQGRTANHEALGQLYVEVLMSAVRFYDDIARCDLGRSPAHVLLLHENDLAALFIGRLIVALRAEGWALVSPDAAYADPIAFQTPQTLITNQGRVAALAVDAGRNPRTLTHLAIEEEQLDALMESRGVFGPIPEPSGQR